MVDPGFACLKAALPLLRMSEGWARPAPRLGMLKVAVSAGCHAAARGTARTHIPTTMASTAASRLRIAFNPQGVRTSRRSAEGARAIGRHTTSRAQGDQGPVACAV